MECLKVPVKYMETHFIVAQCSCLGLDMNQVKALIAWTMFGLVQTIAYIKLSSTLI